MCPVNTNGTNRRGSSDKPELFLLSLSPFAFKLSGEQQALPPSPPWSTMDFRSWLLICSKAKCPPLQALPSSHVCCLCRVFLQPNCWKKLLYFWPSPLSEGKRLNHTLLCFPSRFCWQPAIPLEPLQEPVTLHGVLWPTQLAESSGYYFSQKTCVERRQSDCTADWFTDPGPWICTSSLHSPPSRNLDCRRNAFLPYCVCAQGCIWSRTTSMKSFHGT